MHPNLIKESSVEMSLFDVIIIIFFSKIYFKIIFHRPFVSNVWEYQNTDFENMQQTFTGINWNFLFQDTTDIWILINFFQIKLSNMIIYNYYGCLSSKKTKLKEKKKFSRTFFQNGNIVNKFIKLKKIVRNADILF